jgi:hypothetical protein
MDHSNLQAESIRSSQITISSQVFPNHNLHSRLHHIPTSTLSVLHFSSPTLTMRFSAELVALVAISSFGLIAAAPVAAAEAEAAPLIVGGQYYGGGFE